MVAFLQGFNLPLAITSYKREPLAVGAGVGLMLALAYQTTTVAHIETANSYTAIAKQTMVMTSYANRFTRLCAGAVHVYAGRKFAGARFGGVSQGKLATAIEWFGTFALALIATVWMTTGYYGQ